MNTKAYGLIHFHPGGTKEQYDATIAAVHPDGRLPQGQIFHAAGASPGGWTVVIVHDSKESWDELNNTVLTPRMRAGIEGGFNDPPQETVIEISTLLP